MNEMEKLKLLEEMLELDENTLTPDTILEDLDEWDSIAILSVIAMMDDEFSKQVKGVDVKACEKVSDLLAMMEK